jgi:hypothetical protein
MSLADQQRRFAQSTPLSTPEEQNYLGQARGELGEQLTNQREQLGSLYNPLTMGNNAPNQLQNLGNQQIGAQMNLQGQALLNAYQQRRQALSQASGMAANAAGAVSYQQQPQYDMAGTFGGLAHAIAMQRAMNQQNQGGGADQATRVADYQGWFQPGGAGGVSATAGIASTGGTSAPMFNPVTQTQGLQLPGNWNNVAPDWANAPRATMELRPGERGGGSPLQGGWNFADPRTRQFAG